MYRIELLPEVQEQVAALPREALTSYAEVLVMLEVAPWSGDPYSREHPDGSTRAVAFGPNGEGLLSYLILEDQRRVALLIVLWAGS